jgi:hypothetical protein
LFWKYGLDHAPEELLPVRYGEAVADGETLVPTSFFQVRESLRCSLGYLSHVFMWSYLGIKWIFARPNGFRYLDILTNGNAIYNTFFDCWITEKVTAILITPE